MALIIIIVLFFVWGGSEFFRSSQATTMAAVTVVVIIAQGSGEDPRLGFVPAEIHIIIGVNNTVTWKNQDAAWHTAHSNIPEFDSRMIPPGGSFTHTFLRQGIYPYHCDPHPWMTGTVTVASSVEESIMPAWSADHSAVTKSAPLEVTSPTENFQTQMNQTGAYHWLEHSPENDRTRFVIAGIVAFEPESMWDKDPLLFR
jgi:plastocyanin